MTLAEFEPAVSPGERLQAHAANGFGTFCIALYLLYVMLPYFCIAFYLLYIMLPHFCIALYLLYIMLP